MDICERARIFERCALLLCRLQLCFSNFMLQRNLPQMFALLKEPCAMIQLSILLSVVNEFRPRQFRSVSAETWAPRLKNTETAVIWALLCEAECISRCKSQLLPMGKARKWRVSLGILWQQQYFLWQARDFWNELTRLLINLKLASPNSAANRGSIDCWSIACRTSKAVSERTQIAFLG